MESLEELGVLVFETMPLIHYLQQLKTFQARALKFTTNMCVCVRAKILIYCIGFFRAVALKLNLHVLGVEK